MPLTVLEVAMAGLINEIPGHQKSLTLIFLSGIIENGPHKFRF